jgi:hypothetical protein
MRLAMEPSSREGGDGSRVRSGVLPRRNRYHEGPDFRRSCHFVALVDDFSRYLLGIHAIPTREAVPVLEALADLLAA